MNNSAGATAGIIVVVILAILATLAFVAFLGLRYLRKHHSNPRYIPTQYLKQKWQTWHPRATRPSKDGGYSARLQDNGSAPTLHLRSDNRNSRHSSMLLPDLERAGTQETNNNNNRDANATRDSAAMVDRRTSIRSVVTLPAYSHSARASERVLGREGDRDGVDLVLEQPETAQEEEDRRDEEMEELYQIRAQRRRELAERERRRSERQAARNRGDADALRRLRHESALRAEERESSGAAAMAREYRARSRERRVSSVNYAEVGVARHDGSRVRTNSNDSDRRPLLDSSAASVMSTAGGNGLRPWATQSTLSVHRRDLSTASSFSEDDESTLPPFGRAGSDFEVVSLNQTHSRETSRDTSRDHSVNARHSRSLSAQRPGMLSLELDTSGDLADSPMPSANPPAYADETFEDAPPYRSPDSETAAAAAAASELDAAGAVASPSGAPLLPVINRLPSIRVAEASPIDVRASGNWSSARREQ